MLVSNRYRFILIKTRKTAGSSLEGLLQPLCVPDGFQVSHSADEIVTDAGIVGARAGGESSRGHGAHMSAKGIRKAVGPGTFDSFTKIVPVRDPFDKVVSWYWHVMPQDTKDRVSQDFADARSLFRDWLRMRPSLNTDEKFYKVGKRPFDCFLVRYEHLSEDIESLSRKLGVPLDLKSLPQWKTATRLHRDRDTAEYYDKRTADIVRNKFAYDFDNFGYDRNSVHPARSHADAADSPA